MYGTVRTVVWELGAGDGLWLPDLTLDAYESTVLAWADEMQTTCRRIGVGYTRVLTSIPIEDLILRDLRRQGLVGRCR